MDDRTGPSRWYIGRVHAGRVGTGPAATVLIPLQARLFDLIEKTECEIRAGPVHPQVVGEFHRDVCARHHHSAQAPVRREDAPRLRRALANPMRQ